MLRILSKSATFTPIRLVVKVAISTHLNLISRMTIIFGRHFFRTPGMYTYGTIVVSAIVSATSNVSATYCRDWFTGRYDGSLVGLLFVHRITVY